MRIIDIIDKKKNGFSLTKEEIDFFITEYTKGNIPDYQAAALIMAIFINKMSDEETSNLTLSMAYSGEVLDLSDIPGIKVDKHSTGGVGDKVSLVIAPIVSSCNIPVAKMSGRGLGFTGGTIDKLESIDGFKTSMGIEEFKDHVKKHNIVIAGQTGDLAPADKKIYALRDVTSTVDNISLIASSIMSKKIASGADSILLDIKVGSGAFMKTIEDAEILAKTMVNIGNSLGRKTICILSNMDEPLGEGIGNIIEVKEAIEVLKGFGPEDLKEVCLTVASIMIYLGGRAESIEEGRSLAEEKIKSGEAHDKFKEWIESQGGDISILSNIDSYKKSKFVCEFKSDQDGFINSMDAEEIGKIAMILGAGRETKESVIDPSVGLIFKKKVGDEVKKGDTLCFVHHNGYKNMEFIFDMLRESVKIIETKRTKGELIYKIIK